MKTHASMTLHLEDDYRPATEVHNLSTGQFIRCGHGKSYSKEAAMWLSPQAARRLVDALTQALDKLPLLEPTDPAEFDHPPGL